jgi:prefoldin subunit 5
MAITNNRIVTEIEIKQAMETQTAINSLNKKLNGLTARHRSLQRAMTDLEQEYKKNTEGNFLKMPLI